MRWKEVKNNGWELWWAWHTVSIDIKNDKGKTIDTIYVKREYVWRKRFRKFNGYDTDKWTEYKLFEDGLKDILKSDNKQTQSA